MELHEICERVYKNSKLVTINGNQLRAYAASITKEQLLPQTKDSSVNKQVDKISKAAVYLAYNVINFSFYPENASKRWFVQKDNGEYVGKDDEAHAIVFCLNAAQSQGVLDLTSAKGLAELTLDTVSKVFAPHPDAGKLPLLQERTSCLNE